jgi:Holliday junction resolvase
MPINSRRKGAAGERELAAYLRQFGIIAHRGRQFQGGADSPDVVHDLPDIHLECKRCERGQIYDWLQQARDDAGDRIPVVVHRKNNQDWVAILPMEDLLRMLGKDRVTDAPE